jgi:hypothetical protein
VNEPVFTKSGPPPARTTFLVHGTVDVSGFEKDFTSAFGHDAAAGQAYVVTALTECLSGVRLLGDPPRGILRDERHRLNWRAFPPDTSTWRISWTDSMENTSVKLDGADSLAAALGRHSSEWLIVIDGLAATLEHGEPGIATLTPGGMVMGGGTPPVATLEARVVVLGAHPAAIVGSGHVSGWRTIGRFRKSSVDNITEAFALELERALAKR